jgi:hypothetical protein
MQLWRLARAPRAKCRPRVIPARGRAWYESGTADEQGSKKDFCCTLIVLAKSPIIEAILGYYAEQAFGTVMDLAAL